MKRLLSCATLALCLHTGAASALGADYLTAPSDPNASLATRNVYDYLRTRRGQPENSMIEGQFLGMINQVLYPGKKFYGIFDINQHAINGKLPGIAGSRYDGEDKETNVYRLDPDICSRINLKLIDTWNQAQPIIHLTATPRNPWNQQLGREPDNSNTQKIGKLLRAATLTDAEKIIRAKFWADIDTIAGGLQELEDAGIPVLFRPFAEFNQSNKYYFNKQTAADFNALWKEVFHYYVDAPPAGKGLNNLLFCWEVWALNRNDASANIGPWYPGDNFVDVVAGAFYFVPDTLTKYYLDPVTGAFSFAHSDPHDAPVFNWLISQKRPFGAAQYGLNQDTNTPGDHNFTRAFMDYAPDLAFAAYWNQYQAVERQANASAFVADPRVATHDDLPIFDISPATVTLGALSQTYDGTPRLASVTTAPADLNVIVTYDGSGTAPTNAGSYAVVATIDDPHYFGSAAATLVVAKAAATVTLGSLSHIYDGAPKSATATTVPAGLRRWFSYNGSTTPPSAVGSYTVVCTVNDPNYTGTATGTLTIVDATPPVLTLPSGLVLEATSSAGAVATFSASATDDVSGAVPVTLTPASGTTFPIGTTTVIAKASDAAGNTATGSFTVTVRDSIAPTLSSLTPLVLEATNSAGAVATFSASATDGVSGAVPVTFTPASGTTFPIGTTTVIAKASDAAGNTATGSFTVTVRDSIAPTIASLTPLVLEATSSAGAVATFSASATDDVSGAVPVTFTPASGTTFPIGTTTVTASASDTAGNTATGSFTVTVRDSTAPALSSLTPSVTELWPANHKLIAVTLTANASDLVGVTSLQIVSATSNEPDNGLGDGDTAGDIVITGPLTLNLRAERSGAGTGRIYTISVEARDAAGNATTRITMVTVPKSRGA